MTETETLTWIGYVMAALLIAAFFWVLRRENP